jgi:conjugal transfer pilus assembly protein TraV
VNARGSVSLAACALLALGVGGCSTLGGNVKGSFACRAPEGTCAPTSVIDRQAIGASGAADSERTSPLPPVSGARTLQIVVAAHRDDAGREHEARVVHVVLPDGPAKDWRGPLGTADVLRALGASLESPGAENDRQSTVPTESTAHLPDQLFIPSQPGPALPGASAPATGAPDRPASPDRVPHLEQIEGDER